MKMVISPDQSYSKYVSVDFSSATRCKREIYVNDIKLTGVTAAQWK